MERAAFLLVAALAAVSLKLPGGDGAALFPEPDRDPPSALPQTTATVSNESIRPVADNARCYVCHANYDFNEEPLVFGHAKASIGCVRCHGESTRHSADEDGLTPPDRMFPKAHIRFNCLGCHSWVWLVASDKSKQNRTDLPEKPNHQSVLDGTADKKLCTDCHGDHRLGYRTREWDKRTGRLLRRDATPPMLRSP